MKALTELEQLGYEFILDGDNISYRLFGERPAPEIVRPRLNYLREHRDELVPFLRERAALLDQMDTMEPLQYCRLWADLASRAEWPCTGYQTWADWPADVEMDLRATDGSRQAVEPEPTWVGQRVKIKDLPSFEDRWGLRAIGSEWLEGEPCPTVYLVEE